MLIPKLFEAIRLGNVKSECVLGDRIIGNRQVRLKLVAEVVDPGSNPLATHSQRSSFQPVRAISTEVGTGVGTGVSKELSTKVIAKKNVDASGLSNSETNNRIDNVTSSETSRQANKEPTKKNKRAPRRKHPMSR